MRQAILDAALEAYTEHGGSATVEDVRRRSGASVGSIYHWFGGKEGIEAALYVEALRDYQRGYLAVLGGESDAEAGMRAVVRHHLRWVERNPDLARFLLTSRETGGDELRELNAEMLMATARWLRPQVEAGTVEPIPLDLYYTVLIGPSQEFARHWLKGRMKSSIKKAERVLGDAAWAALRAKGGRSDG
ncbi:MAG TPA: TetR family transcriptional regulator [Thermoleophilaceae bacterium]|nr:TetR family transcriptional regulator [Thermoleophilaceae bacterium]